MEFFERIFFRKMYSVHCVHCTKYKPVHKRNESNNGIRFTGKMCAMHSNCGDVTTFFLNLNKGKLIMQMFHSVWHTIRGVAIHSIIINVSSFKAPVKPSKYLNKTFIKLLNRTLLVVVVGDDDDVMRFIHFGRNLNTWCGSLNCLSHANDNIPTESSVCCDKLLFCTLLFYHHPE